MKDLEKLMRLTNAGALACMEALGSTDSFDEAVEYIRPVAVKKLKRGMLVTIINDCHLPSALIGTTTKVLHKNITTEDNLTWEDLYGNIRPLRVDGVVLLENTSRFLSPMRYLNVSMIYEDPLCLRPATEEEKKAYYKRKKAKNE